MASGDVVLEVQNIFIKSATNAQADPTKLTALQSFTFTGNVGIGTQVTVPAEHILPGGDVVVVLVNTASDDAVAAGQDVKTLPQMVFDPTKRYQLTVTEE